MELHESEAQASNMRKCAAAPVKRSGTAEGSCNQRTAFSSSFLLFLFDLLAMVYILLI